MEENHKSDFRKSCIKRLKFVSRFSKYKKDKKIVESLYKLIEDLHAKKVLLYVPLGFEADVLSLIKRLRRERRVEVFVPFMFEDSFKVVKYRLPLVEKKFYIKEPNNSFLNAKIDLAIVPVVGIDGACKRIGFGKGMYDRFFDRLTYKTPTIAFVQRELCQTSQIITDHYDIQADYIITG
jgi:5-formyltetrahydrofolate cyclo-ligase